MLKDKQANYQSVHKSFAVQIGQCQRKDGQIAQLDKDMAIVMVDGLASTDAANNCELKC